MKHLLLLALISAFSSFGSAHTGETDAAGCHTNIDTGVYHCH